MKIGEIRPLEKIDVEIKRNGHIRKFKTKVEVPESESVIRIIFPFDVKLFDDEIVLYISKDSKLLKFSCTILEDFYESNFRILKIKCLKDGESSNRRKAYRLKCNLDGEIKNKDEKTSVKIKDISLTGVFIETDEKFFIGEKIKIKIEIEKDTLFCKASISRETEKGYGLEFEDVLNSKLSSFINKKQIEEIRRKKSKR